MEYLQVLLYIILVFFMFFIFTGAFCLEKNPAFSISVLWFFLWKRREFSKHFIKKSLINRIPYCSSKHLQKRQAGLLNNLGQYHYICNCKTTTKLVESLVQWREKPTFCNFIVIQVLNVLYEYVSTLNDFRVFCWTNFEMLLYI